MFKKITDERLIIQNLKHIRAAFVVQTTGIIGILIYTGITEGIKEVSNNPLWVVWVISMLVLVFSSMRISVDMEDQSKSQKKPRLYWGVILSAVIGIAIGLLTKFGPDAGSNRDAIILGSVFFICFLGSYAVVYYLRKKRYDDNQEE